MQRSTADYAAQLERLLRERILAPPGRGRLTAPDRSSLSQLDRAIRHHRDIRYALTLCKRIEAELIDREYSAWVAREAAIAEGVTSAK